MSEIDVHLFKELERIDLCLQQYVVNNREKLNGHVLEDFVLDEEAVRKRLSQPGQMPNWIEEDDIGGIRLSYDDSMQGRLSNVVQRFDLNTFETDVLLLGVLEEFDSRYADLFEALHRSNIKRMPSFELALKVLRPSFEERLKCHADFEPDSTLIRYRLIETFNDNRKGWNQTLFRTANAVFHYLLGNDVLSDELGACAKWTKVQFSEMEASRVIRNALKAQTLSRDNQMYPIVVLNGTLDCARLPVVTFEARQRGHSVLSLDVSLLPESAEEATPPIYEALRDVKLRDGVLIVEHWDEFTQCRKVIASEWIESLYKGDIRIVALSEEPSNRLSIPNVPQMLVEMPKLSYQNKVDLLHAHLMDHENEAIDIEWFCHRFSFNQSTLPKLLQEARCYSPLIGQETQVTMEGLRAAFRYHSQKSFGNLAQRIEPKRRLDDLMSSPELKAQLHEIMVAVKYRSTVLQKGFDKKIGYGTGVSVLFHGNSGTGKTMAAEVIAGLLNVDLVKVDLSAVVDKYIGETEKNLARIFDLAENDSGVLFFDEADALFGKRTAVNDSKDKNANLGVSYLLQRLERYSGLVILATNNRGHLDEAFSRRFTFISRFHFPNVDTRAQMWKEIWPQEFTISDDVDFEQLAKSAELTGANIRNIALLSAWLAEEEKSLCINSTHIHKALQREQAKIGRLTL